MPLLLLPPCSTQQHPMLTRVACAPQCTASSCVRTGGRGHAATIPAQVHPLTPTRAPSRCIASVLGRVRSRDLPQPSWSRCRGRSAHEATSCHLPCMLRPRCTLASARSGEKVDRWLGEPLGRGRGHRVGAGMDDSLRRPGKRCVGLALGLLRGPGASGSAPTGWEYNRICAAVKPPRTMRTRCRFSTIMHFASCGPRRCAGFLPPAATIPVVHLFLSRSLPAATIPPPPPATGILPRVNATFTLGA